MMLEASLLRFGGRGAFLNVLYVRCFAYTVSECGTKHFVTVHSVHSNAISLKSGRGVLLKRIFYIRIAHLPCRFNVVSLLLLFFCLPVTECTDSGHDCKNPQYNIQSRFCLISCTWFGSSSISTSGL